MPPAIKKLKFDSKKDISTWQGDLPEFFDCTIVSGDGDEIKLHRLVLAHTSEAFKAMLTTDMKESKTNVVSLSESTKTLQLLFDLIYKGECEGDFEDFKELVIASGKYLILDIRDKCLATLNSLVVPSNAAASLSFAHNNEHKDLEVNALKCIGENFKAVRDSDGWEILLDNRVLMEAAVDAYISYNREKELAKSNKTIVARVSMDMEDDNESIILDDDDEFRDFDGIW